VQKSANTAGPRGPSSTARLKGVDTARQVGARTSSIRAVSGTMEGRVMGSRAGDAMLAICKLGRSARGLCAHGKSERLAGVLSWRLPAPSPVHANAAIAAARL
jgi:hypothetical protein